MERLPFGIDLNTIEILKLLSAANHSIGKLNGVTKLLPNPNVILSLLRVTESKNSSAIENIITTYEDIFKELIIKQGSSKPSKEVVNYKLAIEFGFSQLQKEGFISTNSLIRIHEILEPTKGGIRRLPGTVIKNLNTGEIVHTPPQSENEIREMLGNLETYINGDNEFDPLINLALIHFQFESIHPFYDGNGRTGRILNILYLVLKKKIEYPVLFLSKYISDNKNEYYDLLKTCTKNIIEIHEFVKYILNGINETANQSIDLIMKIHDIISLTKLEMQKRLPSIYSEKIVNHLFSYFYTKNAFFKEQLDISRPTATKYLKLLESHGFIESERVGKEVIYKNIQLLNIFSNEKE